MKVVFDIDWTHNPFSETHWVSRLRENLTSGSNGEGLETGLRTTLNGHEGGNPGYSQGHSYGLPRQSFTRQLFFKWIKQNLKIKSFLGTSKNAVMTQIWIAICIYLLLAYLKFASQIDRSLQRILQLLQLNLFERRDLQTLLRGDPPEPIPLPVQATLKF